MAKVSVGSVPAEAKPEGAGGQLNESTPVSQRDPVGNSPKTDGPQKHPETDAFLPAEYTLNSGNTRRDR